jgi:predicted nucleotidyltransferase
MSVSLGAGSKLEQLEARLQSRWAAIHNAREKTQMRQRELADCFERYGSPDTSLVVFGSVAREEVTSGSDLDWILLIDGQSVPEHNDQEREIERILLDREFIAPGTSGVFAKMVGSHDLVHNRRRGRPQFQHHASGALAPGIPSRGKPGSI